MSKFDWKHIDFEGGEEQPKLTNKKNKKKGQ